jgi:hypothetical protein
VLYQRKVLGTNDAVSDIRNSATLGIPALTAKYGTVAAIINHFKGGGLENDKFIDHAPQWHGKECCLNYIHMAPPKKLPFDQVMVPNV